MDQLKTAKDGIPLLKRIKKGVTKKRIIAVCIIIALLVGGRWGWSSVFGKKVETALNTAQVTKGDITVSISGTGAIEPIEQYNVVPLVKGDIIADHFVEGDTIEKDALLYQIDTKDVENSIEKAMLALQKSQFTHQNNVDAYNNQNVTSPISGLVTNVYVKEGENVSNNGKVADVVDTGTLTLKVPFNTEDVKNVSPGDKATVNLASSFTSVEGTVTRVSTGQRVLDGYITVKDVEIKIQNPGALSNVDIASATIGGADCAEPGTLSYADSKTILAKTSGEVQKVFFYAGDTISAGETIARVENESALINMDTSAINVQDAELALQNLYDQQEEYNITSPISGTVIQKKYKAGDTIDNTSSSVVLAVVADLTKFVFTLNVDELDIAKIQLGQEVQVTADALPNETFTGVVDNISVVGTASNGVTTYPVKVLLEAQKGLLPGMNISAEVVVAESKNTLMIPIDAVNRGNIVYVKDDGTDRSEFTLAGRAQGTQRSQNGSATSGAQQGQNGSAASGAQRPQNGSATSGSQQQSGSGTGAAGGSGQNTQNSGQNGSGASRLTRQAAPEGYIAVVVTTGVNDDSFIEITKGLKEGDSVIVPTRASSGSTTTNPQLRQGTMVVTSGGPPPSGGNWSGGSGGNVRRVGG